MTTRLTLLCHGATRTMREGGFASPDEPLDEGGLRKLAGLASRSIDPVLTSPARAARQTVEAFGADAVTDAALRDIDHGAWTGLSFAAVQARAPEALAGWIADPTRGAPGGESFADLEARLSSWLARAPAREDRLLVITHPMIVRAVLTIALGIPAAAAMRIDIAPLSAVTLSFNRVWRLQGIGPYASVD